MSSPRSLLRLLSGMALLSGLLLACVLTPAATAAATAPETIFRNGFGYFHHPGVLHDRMRLDEIKSHVDAGDEPWASAFDKLSQSRYSRLTYTPRPVAYITRANDSSAYFVSDSIAAYSHALMYYFSGDTRYTEKAVSILNGWAQTLQSVDGSNQYRAQLDVAWAAEVMPRAAELLRYTYQPAPAASTLDVAALSQLFTAVMLPELDPTSPGATSSAGNWELSMAEGAINIGVFTDDPAAFQQGLAMWRARVPAYIYVSSDGAQPVYPPGGRYSTPGSLKCFWNAAPSSTENCPVPSNFQYLHGMAQEACRDIGHTTMGMSAMAYGAQTALLQGVDLFGEEQQRMHDGIEFSARYGLQALDNPLPGNKSGSVDDNLCGGKLKYGGQAYSMGWEYAYAELAVRRGLPMPYTAIMLERVRPTPPGLHMVWATLTGAVIP